MNFKRDINRYREFSKNGKYDFWAHGWYMWAAWTVFALIQVSSNRYLKGDLPGTNMWIHRICGTGTMLATLYHGTSAWKGVGWKVIQNYHSLFAFPVLFAVFLVAVGGVATRSRLRRAVWNTPQALKFKTIHRMFAYLILITGCFAIMSGLYYYR